MQVRKKPVVVEASQWLKQGDHPMVRPLGDFGDDMDIIGMAGELTLPLGRENYGFIETLEGGHLVTPGDYIIRGIKGEYYPCKPDIFEASYEEVPEKEQFEAPENMDAGCVKLCTAMNRLPGIQTFESCQGHGEHPYWVWFIVTDPGARGFLTLSRLMSHNYYGFNYKGWRIFLDHMDIAPQVCFRLEGPSDDVAYAEILADAINELVDDTVSHFNILLDKVGAGAR